jgi:hypothetical protein
MNHHDLEPLFAVEEYQKLKIRKKKSEKFEHFFRKNFELIRF